MLRVDPVCTAFQEWWHYILVQVYCKRCLNAARKWKVPNGILPAEVRIDTFNYLTLT